MNRLVSPLYSAAGRLVEAAAALASPAGGKIGRSFELRRGAVDRFIAWGRHGRDAARPLLWMHAPSVGEGLQAKPVLDALRRRRPELQLAYTFYSPSAVEFASRLDVDFRDVLPFDTSRNAAVLLSALQPTALVFSKLDVWPRITAEAGSSGIRLGLVSATLPANSSRLRGIAPLLLRDAYAALDKVGAVSPDDARRLQALGCHPAAILVTGDTRFDQVASRAATVDRTGPLLGPFASGRFTIVAGSTWPSDERVLLPAIASLRDGGTAFRMIIAPHEPGPAHLVALERWAEAAALTPARLGAPGAGAADVVIVDRVGVLGDLYALADAAFVGGGFHRAGLHSVLEPAAFGVPVIFGPLHGNSREAALLVQAGGARAVRGSDELRRALHDWIADADSRRRAADVARTFVERNLGATERSVDLVEQLLATGPIAR